MLRAKTLLYTFLILVLLFILIDFVSRAIIMSSIFSMEQEESSGHMDRIMAAYENELARIDGVAMDWGYWDDTYSFMKGNNPTYVADNLEGEALRNIRVDYMMFLDNAGQFFFGIGHDMLGQKIELTPSMIDSIISINWMYGEDLFSGKSGLLLLDDMPVMLASRSILTSDGTGPSNGIILVGSTFDVGYFSDIILLELQASIIQEILPDTSGTSPLVTDYTAYLRRLNTNINTVYKVLQDLNDVPILLLKAYINRDLYAFGSVAVNNIRISFVLISIVIFMTLVIVLDKTILSKLSRLSSRVEHIGSIGDIYQRVEAGNARDELTVLARNINSMLDGLEKSQLEIIDRENMLRLITDNMMDMICQIRHNGKIRYVSPSFELVLGYDRSDVIGKSIYTFLHRQDRRKFALSISNGISYKTEQKGEFRFLNANGSEVWVEIIGKIFYNDEGRFQGGIISAREISVRKKMEARLKYMSMYDELTGLYNRACFEDAMQQISFQEKAALVICDIDGLKIINDAMGHVVGDKFLKIVAKIIRKCFREEDLIARIGGDEFAILLLGNAAQHVTEAVGRLRDALDSYNNKDQAITISMSIGFTSTKETSATDLFKVADDMMYREKLHRRQSVRSNSINILLKALEARDFITEGHAIRMSSQVAMIGNALGLPEHKIRDLCLLAQFHDIGKVGVPDSILFKTTPLDIWEHKEMQKHSEIGYRIACSSPDLMPIADWILKHHEWWNGKGYPSGLVGEEIPLECRILAIVDAYDAMTNDRPYRKALTQEKALNELKANAGIQFDPQLVELFIEHRHGDGSVRHEAQRMK